MAARSREYRLNVRFLGLLLLAFLLGATGVFFIHRYQATRLKDRYLTQANQARDTGDAKEIEYLSQYIALNPNDNPARIRVGQLLAKLANPRAAVEGYFILQKALQNDVDAPASVRLQCARIALRHEINIPNEAKRDLEILTKGDPDNLEYADLYAESLLRTNDYVNAETYLTKMITRHKAYVDGYARLAFLKRERNKAAADAADIVLQQMLQYPENAQNYKAWLRMAQYHLRYDNGAACDKALAKARDLAPESPEVLYTQANRKLAKWRSEMPPGAEPKTTLDFDEGVALLDRAIKDLGPLPPTEPLPEYGSPEYAKLDLAAGLYRSISHAYTFAGKFDQGESYAREQVKQFPKNLFLQTELLDVLVQKQQYAEAEKICVKLSDAGIAPAVVELQRGLMAAQQNRWIDAARHLERTLGEIAGNPEYVRQANTMLARCYEKTGEFHRVYEAMRRAVPSNSLDPSWVSTKMSLAETMTRLGLNTNAIREYKDIVDRDPRAAFPLVMLLAKEREKVTGPSPLDEEIKKYAAMAPGGPINEILQARQLRSRKDFEGARNLLLKAIEKYPEALGLRVSVFDADLEDKRYPEAADDLAKTEAKYGNSYEVRIMKVSLIGMQAEKKPERVKDLEALTEKVDGFTPEQQVGLLKRCAYAATALERRDLALAWLNRVSAIQGDSDIDTHYQRFDLAALDNDSARIERVLADIARISGGTDNPSYRLAYAFSLIHQAERVKDDQSKYTPLLERASETLALLERERKEWGRLCLAQAKVADMLLKRDVAAVKFRAAIDYGERGPEVFRRLADLYDLAKNHEAINNLISAYPEAAIYLGNQKKKLVSVLVNSREYAKALETARAAVPADAKDAVELLWLAKIESDCKEPLAAEATLKRAHILKPDDADIWLIYVNTLAFNKKTAEAMAFVEEKKGTLKADEAPLVLAQAYTLTKEYPKARELYAKLVEQKGDSLPVLRSASDFAFSTREFTTASRLLEKLLSHPGKTPSDVQNGKRMLALCTVANNDHNDGVRALGILGFKTADAAAVFDDKVTLDDLRCRFEVLKVIRGRVSRMAAATLLQEIEKRMRNNLTLELQLAYAQVQYSLGDWIDAKRRFQMAANTSEGGPNAATMYASALLRKGELDEAGNWIQRLTNQEPDSQRTMELVARLAVLRDRKLEAVEAVKKWVGKGNPPEIGAMVLEQSGLLEDAEAFYKQAAEDTRRGNGELRLAYAAYLARMGKAEECLAQFNMVADNVPPEKVVPMLAVSLMAIDPQAAPAVVQKMVDRAEAETKKNSKFKPMLAGIYSLVNRVPEAIVLSQEILAGEPNNVFTMNNLAFLLAYKDGKHEDADALLRKAMKIVGPQPTLMDTQATVMIVAGRSKDAIELCKEVLVDEPSASVYVHLAQAYLADGKTVDAKAALQEAKKLNYRMNEFHPLERAGLAGVIGLLEKK